MSPDGTGKTLETTDSGFSIAKEISREGGEHIQIDLGITSTHGQAATVDVQESVPAGIDQSQIGFLPTHEPSEWALDEGTLTLQIRLEGDGSREIIYGLRDIEPEEAEPLATEPRVVAVGGPAGETVDVDPDAPAGPAAEPADGEGPAEGAGAADGGSEPPAEPDAGTEPVRSPANEAVAALEPPLNEEAAAQLAEAIAPHLDGVGADAVTETKLAQLQEDVADVRAYLPAFEEFLGENGRASDIAETLDDLRDRLDRMEESPEDLEDTLADLEERVAELEAVTGGLEEDLADVADRLATVEDWRADIAEVSD